MPYLYTHQFICEKVKAQLPERTQKYVTKLPEYYLGAQGGDIFYLYKLQECSKNLGKYLHRANIKKTFSCFLKSAREENASVRSYIAGYITHYAADTVFHPYIYNLLKTYKTEKDGFKGNRHALIESDIDSYFTQTFLGIAPNEYQYPFELSQVDLKDIFNLIDDATSSRTKKHLSYSAFKRSVKNFFKYSAMAVDKSGIKKKIVFGAEYIFHLPHTLSVLIRRNAYNEKYFNFDKKPWVSPYDDSLVYTDDINGLFDRAVFESVKHIVRFFDCVEKGELLPSSDFNKQFTGEKE